MMKYWIIPCNVKDYDVIGAFNKLSEIDWKQSNNMKSAAVGDMVLIYLSVPIHVLNIYVKLKEVNKPKSTIEDSDYIMKGDNYVNYGNYMQLELLESINELLLTHENLKLNGLKGNIQGPRSLKDNLLSFVLEKYLLFLIIQIKMNLNLKILNIKKEKFKLNMVLNLKGTII